MLRLMERSRLAVREMKGGTGSHKQGMAGATPEHQGHKRRDVRLEEAQQDRVDQVSAHKRQYRSWGCRAIK